MKRILENRKLGFWLTVAAACVALIGAVAYLIAYSLTADPVTGEWDRVFKWTVFLLMIGGSLISLGGELLRLRFVPILTVAAYGVALAMHAVETAYPLADVLTKVPFFGGDPKLAITFTVIFAIAAVVHTAAAFMEHNTLSK